MAEVEPEAAAFPSWFLIHTQPCKESAVVSKLAAYGFESFLPLTTAKRVTGAHVPLFASYLFVRISPTECAQVDELLGRLPYLGGVVHFGSAPAEVGPEIIEFLQSREVNGMIDLGAEARKELEIEEARRVEEAKTLTEGEKVRVMQGPFAGQQGLFQSSKDGRIMVLFGWMKVNFEAREIARA